MNIRCAFKIPFISFVSSSSVLKLWLILLCSLSIPAAYADTQQQYPFLCQTMAAGLGQPEVDNYIGNGTPVLNDKSEVVGYSANCRVAPKVDYFYKPKNEMGYLPLPKNEKGQYTYPEDVDTLDDNKLIVRFERGVLNRFLYSITIAEDPIANKTPEQSGYQNKLVMLFNNDNQSPVGLGHMQSSDISLGNLRWPRYSTWGGNAIVYTTGADTSIHYNLKLGLVSAQELKRYFIQNYGQPQYTLGMGGRQQYVYAQQDPTLLDGIFTWTSFSDLITELNAGLDCPLLDYYFDSLASTAPDSRGKRTEIIDHPANEYMKARGLAKINGSTNTNRVNGYGSDNCASGWHELTQRVLNPYYNWWQSTYDGLDKIATQSPIYWTIWANESAQWEYGTYPTDPDGFTPDTYSNEGVQYGLVSLKNHSISKSLFLDLNAKVGGWKLPHEFSSNIDGPPFYLKGIESATAKESFENGVIAPRRVANEAAIQAAVASGNIFRGNIDIPIIDVQVKGDHLGDINNNIDVFKLRARLNRVGKAGNQIILMIPSIKSKSDSHEIEKLYLSAIENIENWIVNIKKHKERSLVENKPASLNDACLIPDEQSGDVYSYSGPHAWDGVLDPKQQAGECTRHFPIHGNARMMAGEDIAGDKLKCDLISVESFIANNGYGDVKMNSDDIVYLKKIFPAGVCDTR